MAGFMPGRVQMEARCGCDWRHIEPSVDPDDEEAMLLKVTGEARAHQARLGHSPTVVLIREDWFSPDTDRLPFNLDALALNG